tara:strand:- start:26107 stop:26520 length:414 start_codon:yes stop_codon:yes gene_type:complete
MISPFAKSIYGFVRPLCFRFPAALRRMFLSTVRSGFPVSLLLGLPLATLLFAGAPLQADGCYICKPGSAANCKHYCKYRGEDDWENRKKCEKAGCDIGGTASCPTEGGYQVCYVILDPQDPANYLSWRFGLDHLSDQ